MRRCFFEILDVVEHHGRPIAEIAAEVARERGISLAEMRGQRGTKELISARWEAMKRIRAERPDLNSACIARYFHRDGSTIRHAWRSLSVVA